MLIKEMLEEAKKGDEYYKKYLYRKYFYLAHKYYVQNHDKITLNEVLKIYKSLLDEFYQIDYPLGLCEYLTSKFNLLNSKKSPDEKICITDIIVKAKRGDKNARDQLINHYSFIVKKYAQRHLYMEYDDLVQCGMVKLITFIDHELEIGDGLLFSPKLTQAIDYYFDVTLKKEVESSKINSDSIIRLENDCFNDKLFEIELEDLINSTEISKKNKLYALKYFIENRSLTEIADIYGCSKQNVSSHVNTVVKKLKSEYIK